MNSASLQALRVFCTVVRTGSFKSAAARIFVSPSAVSHRIKSLEDQLGSPLFERKVRSMNLTDFGETVFSKIAPLIDEIDKQIGDLADIADAEAIKITLPPFFSTEIFLPRLQDFTTVNKHVIITLDTHDQYPDKHPEGSDISILLAETEPDAACVVKLLPLTLVPACAPSLKIDLDTLSLDTVSEVTLLIHSARKDAWNQWFQQRGEESVAPRNVMVLDNMFAVVRAAEQGLGLALVPELLIDRWTKGGKLVHFPECKVPTSHTYYLVADAENLNKPQVVKLIEWVVDTFQ